MFTPLIDEYIGYLFLGLLFGGFMIYLSHTLGGALLTSYLRRAWFRPRQNPYFSSYSPKDKNQ